MKFPFVKKSNEVVFLPESNFRGNHAGTKARNDADQIFRNTIPYKLIRDSIRLTSDDEELIHSSIRHKFQLFKVFAEANRYRGSVIFIQYPLLCFDYTIELIEFLKRNNNEIVFLVHDVHSLKDENLDSIASEIKILNLSDGLILHNVRMKEALTNHGLKVNQIYLLNIFDYLGYANIRKYDRFTKKKEVVIAGNLAKMDYIEDLARSAQEIRFHLFGPGFKKQLNIYDNIKYIGEFGPEEIISKLDGGFGLIWDGESISGGIGRMGNYTRYNTPHKLSLYVRCGLPVIVWKEAAIASFVEKENIGILVSDLSEIPDVLKIEKSIYQNMLKNIDSIKLKISNGDSLKSAIDYFKE